MSKGNQLRPKSILRRTGGILLAALPFGLLVASIISGCLGSGRAPFAGIVAIVLAAAIGIMNFHLSFVRPRIFFKRHGSMNDYRFISGVPVVGTVLVCLGGVLGFGAVGSAMVGIAVLAMDTGGLTWFVISTWRDKSLWNS
jgi:hypothetical protein